MAHFNHYELLSPVIIQRKYLEYPNISCEALGLMIKMMGNLDFNLYHSEISKKYGISIHKSKVLIKEIEDMISEIEKFEDDNNKLKLSKGGE